MTDFTAKWRPGNTVFLRNGKCFLLDEERTVSNKYSLWVYQTEEDQWPGRSLFSWNLDGSKLGYSDKPDDMDIVDIQELPKLDMLRNIVKEDFKKHEERRNSINRPDHKVYKHWKTWSAS